MPNASKLILIASTFGRVKQFLSGRLIFALALSIFAQSSFAQMACFELFVKIPQSNTKSFENQFKKLKKENPVSKQLSETSYNLPKSITDEWKEMGNPEKVFDRALMGPLRMLYDFKINPKTKKVQLVENKFTYPRLKKETVDLHEQIKNSDNRKYEYLFEASLRTEKLTENTTLVHATSLSQEIPNPVKSAIKNRFSNLYLQMVSWNYRLNLLVKDRPMSSIKMIDELSVYANDAKFFEYALTFDNKVWETQKQIMTHLIDQYHQAKPAEQDSILVKISNPTEPFLPLAGIAQAKSLYSALTPEAWANANIKPIKYPVELKRYFKNDIEDPLNLLNLSKKADDFIIRHKMLYQTIEAMPPETPLEIHAHSILHVRAYSKLGFKNVGLIKSEKFKDTEIHLLKATREEALENIKRILGSSF